MIDEGGLLLPEEKEFARSYQARVWWVEHRALLKRFGYVLFIACDAILLFFGGWQMLDAFLIHAPIEEQLIARAAYLGQTDLHQYTLANAAVDLEVEEARTISTGNNRYDFFTTLNNPNEDWWAEFTYVFTYGDGQTDVRRGFILPGSEKPVAELAVTSSSPVPSATLVIDDIEWRRVDHHVISDYATWAQDRLHFAISDTQFTIQTGSDGHEFGRATFSVENVSAFSYYDVGFFVLLFRGHAVVGVSRTTLGNLVSAQETMVTLNWFGTLPSVSEVQVIPDLNIFDVGVYKPLMGETTRDTRTRVFSR